MNLPRTLALFGLLLSLNSWAQNEVKNKENFVLSVRRTSHKIIIDGNVTDEAWLQAETTSPFINKWPLDSGAAQQQTEVKLLFDDDNIYVSAKLYQDRNSLTIQTLKRDQIDLYWQSDGFAIVLDPMNQRVNGFFFGVNPAGAQIEGAINAQGNWMRLNENWDNKWFSATQQFETYWTVEMAIPFSSLRFKKGSSEWGLNFVRNNRATNIFSSWASVPLQFNGFDLGYLGTLRWDELITPHQSKVTLIPYWSVAQSRNFEDGENRKQEMNAGLDAKVAVTSSLNLDITLRPDFSNVEVDRQMTNVTRFSLLFPERRNFFLENADLFSNIGSWQVMPFFSRRIGLRDGSPVPITAGLRLSGNVTSGLRIGVMDIQTEATAEQSANNYFVTSVQQQLWTRSSLKFYGANRTTTQTIEGDTEHDFNRTFGTEFQYVPSDGSMNFTIRAHGSQTPEQLKDNHYFSAQLSKFTRTKYAGLMVERIGENYVNDFGFVARLYNYDAENDTTVRIGHYNVNPWAGYIIYPKNSTINQVEFNTWSIINYKTNGDFLERNTSVNVSVDMKNTSSYLLEAFNTGLQLPFATDIIDSGTPLPVERYRYTHYRFRYSSDSRKRINGDINIGGGRFYNGTRLEIGGNVNARKQPWGSVGIMYAFNRINLKEYGKADLVLIGPRTEISLRQNLWWTTFLQFNTQSENFNINSRLQWRFKPMSDLFLVYTDNYTTTNFDVRNRGIVLKFTYWLNL